MDTLTPQQRSAAMSAVRGKNTRPELVVRKLLYALGYRYRLHVRDLPGRPDIAFRKRQCLVFVNGCFWHGHDCPRGSRPTSNVEFWQRKIGKNLERDQRVREELGKDGWRVLTIWECETKDQASLQRRLSRFLDGRPEPRTTS
jgi:DNA mismatch endonuclease, patch repair protein